MRVTFAMGSDGVLPRLFGKTDSRFKIPVLATVIIGVIAAIGVWLYTFGSSSVVDSFDTVVSVDGLLFALYYALTSIATAVYYRKLARTSGWNIIHIAVFPLAAAGFVAYIVVRSVEGLGGWSGRDLIMADIAAFSGVRMEPGTLYGALSRLERRGWVRPLATDERRRPYEITAAGQEILAEQVTTMQQIVRVARLRTAMAWGA